VSNGYFSLQGYQVGTATASRTNLGPFTIPFGGVTFEVEYALTAGTTTVSMNSFSNGVIVVPPIGSPPVGVTLKWKTVLTDSGDFISTQQPSMMQWDTVNSHVPANLYLVASGNITVTVMYL
jgi:hypothetical protein